MPVGWLLVAVIIILTVLAGMLAWENVELKRIEHLLETPPSPTIEAPEPAPVPINPHQKAIVALETDAGVPLSRIAKLIVRDEGKRTRPYNDSTGTPTIGVGRNLKGNGLSVTELHAITNEIDYHYLMSHTHIQHGRVYIPTIDLANRIFTKPLTEHDIQLLLIDDLNNVTKEAQQVFGTHWHEIDEVRQEVIIDTIFNLGKNRFLTFKHFIEAVKQGNWNTAAAELLLSDAAKTNVLRYHRNSLVMKTGDAKYFGL